MRGIKSNKYIIGCGVPLESILESLLLFIYNQDLTYPNITGEFSLFVDDYKHFLELNNNIRKDTVKVKE